MLGAWNMYCTRSLKMPSSPGRLHFVVHVEELEHVQDDVGQIPNRAACSWGAGSRAPENPPVIVSFAFASWRYEPGNRA
jgi:hypothetical protein